MLTCWLGRVGVGNRRSWEQKFQTNHLTATFRMHFALNHNRWHLKTGISAITMLITITPTKRPGQETDLFFGIRPYVWYLHCAGLSCQETPTTKDYMELIGLSSSSPRCNWTRMFVGPELLTCSRSIYFVLDIALLGCNMVCFPAVYHLSDSERTTTDSGSHWTIWSPRWYHQLPSFAKSKSSFQYLLTFDLLKETFSLGITFFRLMINVSGSSILDGNACLAISVRFFCHCISYWLIIATSKLPAKW